MNDSDQVGEARAREQRAREREARARSHQLQADQEAKEATDPETTRRLRAEAQVHARAAKLHHEAVEIQANHAREHES